MGQWAMRWVGLVRNVMLGREGLHRDVLLRIAAEAGGVDVRNHLTTGNLTFGVSGDAAAVGAGIEEGVAEVIGRHEPVILREVDWLVDVLDDDPFTSYAAGDWELEVGFLPLEVPALDAATLTDPAPTVIVRVGEHEVFTARPRSGGRRPHVVPLLERASGTKATSRGWSTLEKIAKHGR